MLRNLTENEKRIILDGVGNLVAYRGNRDQAMEIRRQAYLRAATRQSQARSAQGAARMVSRDLVMA